MSDFLTKFLREKANEAINKVDEPFRSGLNNLLPEFGDSARSFGNNSFDVLIQNKAAQSNEKAAILAGARSSGTATGPLTEKYDWRARLRPKKQGETLFYAKGAGAEGSDHLMRPIQESNGLVWQYTPTLYVSGTANYNSSDMQGQNYPINTFNNSRAPDLTLTSDFTANDIYEARYLLAVITFLRIAHKAYYGEQDVARGLAGTPPPVLLFEYLGEYGFNKVPVVLQNYNMMLNPDVDYVPVEVNNKITYVPTETNITISLLPQYTPHKLRNNFDLAGVANGSLYNGGYI